MSTSTRRTKNGGAAADAPVRRGLVGLLSRTLRYRHAQAGLVLVLLVAAVAFIGPFIDSQDPTRVIGVPLAPPGTEGPLGTDYIGRDVLSRFLHGGAAIIILAFLSTVLGVGIGTVLGLVAGYRRGVRGQLIMRTLDIALSFPALLLALLFVSMVGAKDWLILLTVAVTHVPYVARVVESSSLAVTGRGFVQYAEMIGTPRQRILSREILPSVAAPLTVQFGIRMTWSINLIAALAYLGFGRPGPAADWGKMINENQANIFQSPWPVFLPVFAIAVISVGMNLLTDGFGRAAGINSGRA